MRDLPKSLMLACRKEHSPRSGSETDGGRIMSVQKVLIVAENEEKYLFYYHRMAKRMDARGILRSKSFEDAKKLLRDSAVDLMLMEPEAFLAAGISAATPKPLPPGITGHARLDIDYVRAYIFSHYGEKLSLKKLSSLISVTPNHLCHVFRQTEGIGLAEFVENTRLERAAALLCGTDDQVSVIAGRGGFKTGSYFCERFRAAYGMTPKQYRLRNQKQ